MYDVTIRKVSEKDISLLYGWGHSKSKNSDVGTFEKLVIKYIVDSNK